MEILWIVVGFSLLFECLSLSTGMGFGTKLAPALFLLGYTPLQVVPVILMAQVITGLISGWFHSEFENIQLSIFPLSKTTELVIVLTFCGCMSISLSIFLTYVLIQPNEQIINIFVSTLVIIGGLVSLWKTQSTKSRKTHHGSFRTLMGFGVLAGFIKGVGGSGYGPILTIGQINAGVYEKSAIGIMPLAESGVAFIGVVSLFLFKGNAIDLVLFPSVFTGSYFAAILSPYIVRTVPNKVWKIVIPLAAFTVGIVSFLKMFFF